MSEIVGSILHGAYGDYYEQIVSLRYFKWKNPETRIVLFFANDLRKKELAVFDLSFADGAHSHAMIGQVHVDRYLQFQVFDPELKSEVLAHLPDAALAKIDQSRNIKPWRFVRQAWKENQEICDLRLSELGKNRLPNCESENQIVADDLRHRFTVGFLWRYRRSGGFVSSAGQRPQEELIQSYSLVFRHLIEQYNAQILVCGMGVTTTDENRDRTDSKYSSLRLALPSENVTYLQGLSWGLEMEIVRRCSLCVLMASGFSEAVWLKRRGKGVVLIDAPRHYIAKLLWNRMPFFDVLKPRELFFHLWQPHTASRVLRYLRRKNLLPHEPRP